jgi:hypothetical protein
MTLQNQTQQADSDVQLKALTPLAITDKQFGAAYFVTTPGGLTKRPPDGKKCFLTLLEDTRINDCYSVACGLPEIVNLTYKIGARSSEKQRSDAQTAALDESKSPKHGPISGKVVEETYWDSPEAKKLFLGNPSDSRDVVKVLKQRID